jgi:hypothetical protein
MINFLLENKTSLNNEFLLHTASHANPMEENVKEIALKSVISRQIILNADYNFIPS